MAKIEKIKKGTATIYPATVPQAVVDPTSGKNAREEFDEKANHGYESAPKTLKSIDEAMVNAEHALADIVAHLEGRIKALEALLAASRYNTIQVNELSVVENVKLKGADTKLFGTGAPIITPDFEGQEYLDQTAKIWYDAVGIGNAGDWKPRTNA